MGERFCTLFVCPVVQILYTGLLLLLRRLPKHPHNRPMMLRQLRDVRIRRLARQVQQLGPLLLLFKMERRIGRQRQAH